MQSSTSFLQNQMCFSNPVLNIGLIGMFEKITVCVTSGYGFSSGPDSGVLINVDLKFDVRVLNKKSTVARRIISGSSFSTFPICTLIQLIIKILRVENGNTLIVGPVLIDTVNVVLFKVHLNKEKSYRMAIICGELLFLS